MVEFKKVTKIYDNLISAVYDVDFKIDPGEFVFLIGPSGSGKTTIIKMLIRDEVPTDGHIYFNDVDITRISRSKVYKLRREVGVVFQDFKLVPDKTAYENVSFAMEAAGKKNKEIKETVPYVLDIVGLSNRMKAFPRQLSGGEQQRVAIARAIANNPKILIADEPTGNLDPASSWDIVQVLTKINNWGTTVIMSTHGTDIVNSLNKRVIQMEKGRIIRDDNKGQYELVQTFENETLKTFDKPASSTKESKKKTFQVKIEKDQSDNSTEEKLEPVQGVENITKKQTSFSKLFNIFRKHKSSQEDLHQSIMQTLTKESKPQKDPDIEKSEVNEDSKTKDKESDNKIKSVATEHESKDELKTERPLTMKFNLKESAKMARSLKDQTSEDNEKSTTKYSKILNDAEKISVEDMNLPKSVKSDLKSAGFKTVQDIINAGPKELSNSLVIDPEEVILISKEIKKITEQNN